MAHSLITLHRLYKPSHPSQNIGLSFLDQTCF